MNLSIYLALALTSACFVGCASSTAEQHKGLLSIKDAVGSHQASSVTVKRINYTVFTTRAASPEDFAHMRGQSVTLQLDERNRRSLLKAIEDSKTAGPNDAWRPDIRLGLYFKDASGKVIHTVFTDARYWNAPSRRSLIDGTCWKIRGGLIKFAEQVISTNSEK